VLHSRAERHGRNTGTVTFMKHSLTYLQQSAVVMLHTLYWIISHVVSLYLTLPRGHSVRRGMRASRIASS